jgi:hypothetical protein
VHGPQFHLLRNAQCADIFCRPALPLLTSLPLWRVLYPSAANSTKTQEEKLPPMGITMSVPPRKTSVADARVERRLTDWSQILRAVTETVET